MDHLIHDPQPGFNGVCEITLSHEVDAWGLITNIRVSSLVGETDLIHTDASQLECSYSPGIIRTTVESFQDLRMSLMLPNSTTIPVGCPMSPILLSSSSQRLRSS